MKCQNLEDNSVLLLSAKSATFKRSVGAKFGVLYALIIDFGLLTNILSNSVPHSTDAMPQPTSLGHVMCFSLVLCT